MPRVRLRFREFLLLVTLASLITASYAIRARLVRWDFLEEQGRRIHQARSSARAWKEQIDRTERMLADIPKPSASWVDVYDLRLIPVVKDIAEIPAKGKNLIVVAQVGGNLEFRVFDGQGRLVVDIGEPGYIGAFKDGLDGLWPPHELTDDERRRTIAGAASIVDAARARIRQYLRSIRMQHAKLVADAEEQERLAGKP